MAHGARRLHSKEIGDLLAATPLDPPNQAPPLGRGLRLLLGALLLADVIPIYLRESVQLAWGAGVVVLLLVGALTAANTVLGKHPSRGGGWIGAAAAMALLVVVYLLGTPGGPLFGRGEGELGAVTFLGLSLIVAAVRADRGCEVMSIPGLWTAKRTQLPCLLFSPTDSLERRIRRRLRDRPRFRD